MGSWTVSEAAIAALKQTKESLTETSDAIKKRTASLEQAFEANKQGLGAHASEIAALIEELQAMETEASAPVKKLVLKLHGVSQVRINHVNEDKYSQIKGRIR